MGMAQIATGDFGGYVNLAHSVNNKFRKLIQYQDEPIWDGTKEQTVLVYGEQGLGDEIMYASIFEDAAQDANILVECDERLEGLFRRSFPHLTVHGTRRSDSDWVDAHKLDASIPSGMLTKLYRTQRDSFPGKRYLIADPERKLQWRALFNSWGKRPKIGICWSGGSPYCKPDERHMGLEAFRPLIESLNADFVSLQYKDADAEIAETGLPVRHIKRAVQSPDYDDTAAFVAELDMVIGVHTSVHHLAGALGVPGLIFVPHKSLWLYAGEFPWYDSARLIRQNKGEAWVQTVKRSLNDQRICRLRSA
jgi:ADP-heptose:LPS heptosyltransferase